MSEQKVKYANVPVAEREEILKANAEYSEKTLVKRPYSKDELDEFANYVVGFLNKIEEVEEEISEKTSPLKDKIKELKLQAKEFQLKCKNGYEPVEIQVYGFKNFEDGLVEYYNVDGKFEYSRRLMPAEKQGTIFTLPQTGTND